MGVAVMQILASQGRDSKAVQSHFFELLKERCIHSKKIVGNDNDLWLVGFDSG